MAFHKVGNLVCTDCLRAGWIFGLKHCISYLFNNCALGRESVGG
jgi:hypothetical protein